MRCQFIVALVLLVSLDSYLKAQEPLLQYKFDASRSRTARDSAGSKLDRGRLGSTAQRIADTPGMASRYALDLSAEGTESWVSTGRIEDIDLLSSFTLTTWLKLKGLNEDHGGDENPRLFSNKHDDFQPGFIWALDAPNKGDRGPANFRPILRVEGDRGDATVAADTDVSASDWAFLAVTYDGSAKADNAAFYYGDELAKASLLGTVKSLNAGTIRGISSFRDSGVGFSPIDRNAALQTDYSVNGLQDDIRFFSGIVPLDQLEAIRLENLVPVEEVPLIPCNPDTGGDVDGDGRIGFSDFLILSANFGLDVDSHEQGDVDCDGVVSFGDFIVQSAWFGKWTPGVLAVPEPSGLALASVATLGLLLHRPCRAVALH